MPWNPLLVPRNTKPQRHNSDTRERVAGDGFVGKVLAQKYKDLSLDHSCFEKRAPVIPVLGYGDEKDPGVCWPASQAESVNSRFSEKPCFTKYGGERLRKMVSVECAHTYTHRNT